MLRKLHYPGYISSFVIVWFQKIFIPPPGKGLDSSLGGGSICLIFQGGGGRTIGKYFQWVLMVHKRVTMCQILSGCSNCLRWIPQMQIMYVINPGWASNRNKFMKLKALVYMYSKNVQHLEL